MNSYGKSLSIFDVAGKKALISGGTKGIGREMAICLLENGCDIFALGRNTAVAADMVEYAKSLGRRYVAYPCDVTKTDQVVESVAAVQKEVGRIDILINCAGTNIIKMLPDMDDESWDTVLGLNLKATFVVTREVSKVMRKQQYGKIINLSSMKSFLGVSDSGYTAYCASKGAINMLTKQLACELAADHITVNAIAPTFIRTDINAKQLDDDAFKKSLEDRIPVGRIGQFSDVMGLLLLLVSDASQFITGQTLMLDGGLAARQ